MGQITFKLEAEEAKAVGAFLRVVDAQKKAERAFKDVAGAANTASAATKEAAEKGGGAMDGLKSAALSAVAGFATFATVKSVMSNVIGEINAARDATLEFGKELKNVLSLQTQLNKPQVQEEIRSQVLDRSSAYGFDPKAVANLTGDVQTHAGTMDPKEREKYLDTSLRSAKLFGSDDAGRAFFDAESSVHETFGDQAGDAVKISNRLGKLRLATGMALSEMKDLLEELGPAAVASGYSVDETFGGLDAAAHSGGDPHRMTKALGRAMVKMSEAQRQGILAKTGSLSGDIDATLSLRDSNPEAFGKMGLEKSLPALVALRGHKDQIDQSIAELKATDGSDVIRQQLAAKLTDAKSSYLEQKETIQQHEANEPKRTNYVEAHGQKDLTRDYRKLGLRESLPNGLKWTAGPQAWFNEGLEKLSGADARNFTDTSAGYAQVISELRRAGRPEQANRLELEAGLDVPYRPVIKGLEPLVAAGGYVPKLEHFKTGPQEAQKYQEWLAKGGDVGLNEFIPYLRAQRQGDAAGAQRIWEGHTRPDADERGDADRTYGSTDRIMGTAGSAAAHQQAADSHAQAADRLMGAADAIMAAAEAFTAATAAGSGGNRAAAATQAARPSARPANYGDGLVHRD